MLLLLMVMDGDGDGDGDETQPTVIGVGEGEEVGYDESSAPYRSGGLPVCQRCSLDWARLLARRLAKAFG